MRSCTEFTASLIPLNVLWRWSARTQLGKTPMPVDVLLLKLGKLFQIPKLQTVFSINNDDMTSIPKDDTQIDRYKNRLLEEYYRDVGPRRIIFGTLAFIHRRSGGR